MDDRKKMAVGIFVMLLGSIFGFQSKGIEKSQNEVINSAKPAKKDSAKFEKKYETHRKKYKKNSTSKATRVKKQSSQPKKIEKNGVIDFVKFEKKTNPAKILATIDGGAATDKSPIAYALAKSFNLIYLEMGDLYRTVANVLNQHKLKPKEENKQKIEDFLKNVSWKTVVKKRCICFVMDGEIFSDRELHSKFIDTTVSVYAHLFESIHHFCHKVARSILSHVEEKNYSGLIAEGRTCGTLFFPEADLKFWFNAVHKKQKLKPGNWLQNDILDETRPFFSSKKAEDAIPIWIRNRSTQSNIQMLAAFIEQKLDEKNELAKLKKK